MKKDKTISKSSPQFAKGGSGKMAGKGSAGPQAPAQTTSAGKSADKFAKGGSGKMAGKGAARPQKPAQTASQ